MLMDVVVLAVITLFVVSGCRAGLMKSLLGFVSFALSIIVSFAIYPLVSEILFKTPLYDFLTGIIRESDAVWMIQNADGKGVQNFSAFLAEAGIDAFTQLPEGVAYVMINILSFVLVLVISRVVISVISSVLNIITKLPIIKQFNKLGGGVVGGIKGILLLYIVFAVMVVFVPFEEDSEVLRSIEESSIAGKMYTDNFILDMIDKGEGMI